MTAQHETFIVGLALWPFGPDVAEAMRDLRGVAVLSPDDREGGTVMVVCDATSPVGATDALVQGARRMLASHRLDVEIVGTSVASRHEMTGAVADAFPETVAEPLELGEAILCYLAACQPTFAAL